MLKGDFYTVLSESNEEGHVSALLRLNTSHKIFEGHFPGQPVVPGVCSMQIIRELTESATNEKLTLVKADFLKFLSVITPREFPELTADLNYKEAESGLIVVTGSLFFGETIFVKFKGGFKKG
jgi:3-hydroxyacyl-[acyl-carrier-protein] dehydratase